MIGSYSRRNGHIVVVSLFLTAAVPAFGQERVDQSEITAVNITDNLYMIRGAAGNVGIAIGDDGLVMIDAMEARMTDGLLASIAELTDRPISFVVNTHWHHDHTGGNEHLAKDNAVIAAHENTRRRMIVEQIIVPPMTGGRAPALPEGGWPVISFTGNMTLHFGTREIRATHVKNAHTDGDVVIVFVDDDVIHMGDVLFSRQYPNIDVGSGGTIDGMIAAQEFALKLAGPNTRIIPGHGDLASPAELAASIGMLKIVRDRVAALAAEGLSQEEVVARMPLSDLDEEWGKGYIKAERMVIQAYKSIVKQTK